MRRMGLNALSAALQEVADAHVVGTKDWDHCQVAEQCSNHEYG